MSAEFSFLPLPQQPTLHNWSVPAKSVSRSSVDKHYQQQQQTLGNPTLLRNIMICSGICNCSGQCGNGLIKGAILYQLLIKGESQGALNYRWFKSRN